MFEKENGKERIVVTGTSGIGKSVILVYLVVRLLVESDVDNHPPIIIFHTKRTTRCLAFGGDSVVRSGDIEDFEPFLGLPETWCLVDSAPEPVLDSARTVIAASPKTLYGPTDAYKDVDKIIAWQYYMAPWSLEELAACRSSVAAFNTIPLETMEAIYEKIGDIPRYVLADAKKKLGPSLGDLTPEELEAAMKRTTDCLTYAVDNVRDPVVYAAIRARKRLDGIQQPFRSPLASG